MIDAIIAFFTPEIMAQVVTAVIGLVIFSLVYFVLNI